MQKYVCANIITVNLFLQYNNKVCNNYNNNMHEVGSTLNSFRIG